MKQQPLRTTVVGSYPFPGWLELCGRHRDELGPDAVLGEQQRAQSRHQVEVEDAADPGGDRLGQLVAGGAVAHEAVGVDVGSFDDGTRSGLAVLRAHLAQEVGNGAVAVDDAGAAVGAEQFVDGHVSRKELASAHRAAYRNAWAYAFSFVCSGNADDSRGVWNTVANMLLRAGYEAEDAVAIASNVEVDLHLAEDLLRRGCPPKTALKILI